jgi:hypothetical protein
MVPLCGQSRHLKSPMEQNRKILQEADTSIGNHTVAQACKLTRPTLLGLGEAWLGIGWR